MGDGHKPEQAHSLVNLPAELRSRANPVNQHGSKNEKQDERKDPKNRARPDRCLIVGSMEHWTKPGPVDADHLIEVPVDGVIHAFSVPGLTRPKPHPTGTANERTDHDHSHPQPDNSEDTRP